MYIAPEIIREHGYQGPPADVWSAGVCLWALVVGSIPFKNDNDYQLDYKNCGVPLSPEFKDLCSKVLTTDVSKRISAVQILAHPWFADMPCYLDIMDE